MLFEMTVCEKQQVDIPDLPADVLEFVEKNNGIISMRVEMERYEDGDSQEYAELWVSIDQDSNTIDDKDETFMDRLAELEGFDEEKMQDYAPWFQSDTDDGYRPCEEYIAKTKEMYTNVRFV